MSVGRSVNVDREESLYEAMSDERSFHELMTDQKQLVLRRKVVLQSPRTSGIIRMGVRLGA